MEENLEPNNEISDNVKEPNSLEINVSKSEKINNQKKENNLNENSNNSKNNFDPKVDIKDDND